MAVLYLAWHGLYFVIGRPAKQHSHPWALSSLTGTLPSQLAGVHRPHVQDRRECSSWGRPSHRHALPHAYSVAITTASRPGGSAVAARTLTPDALAVSPAVVRAEYFSYRP